jgi:hypothetical protein
VPWILVLLTLLGSPSTPRVDLKKTCSRCHPLAVIRAQKLSREEWDDEVRKMESMGAVVKNREALLDYLASTYGVKKKVAR